MWLLMEINRLTKIMKGHTERMEILERKAIQMYVDSSPWHEIIMMLEEDEQREYYELKVILEGVWVKTE